MATAGTPDASKALSLLKSKMRNKPAASTTSTTTSASAVSKEPATTAKAKATTSKPVTSSAGATLTKQTSTAKATQAKPKATLTSTPAKTQVKKKPVVRNSPPASPPVGPIEHSGTVSYDDIPVGGKSSANDMFLEDDGEDEGPPQTCPHCGRSFTNSSTFSKHLKICKKVFMQKRKVFDVAGARIEGVLDGAPPPPKSKPSKKAPPKKDWKKQSEAFRAMIAAARTDDPEAQAAAQAKIAELGPDPSMVACPHCSRRFNPEAAERHIAICQKVFSKKATQPKKAAATTTSSATKKKAAAKKK